MAKRNGGAVRRIFAADPPGQTAMSRSRLLDKLTHFLHPREREPLFSCRDLEFIEGFRRTVAGRCSDPGFTTEDAAAAVSMSRMHVNRRLREITGLTTHQFIQAMRLEAARELLGKPLSIAAIARAAGFRNSSHFACVFRERFGTSPSEYRRQNPRAREPTRPGSRRSPMTRF
jgi:AraC-like DNA-binding protein